MPDWLAADELRIGLGCMRVSTEDTVWAALDAGITVFDTARAYGDNERLLQRALAGHPRGAAARIVTKGGMSRPDGAWRPDGRAREIARDCDESLRALDGRPIDLYLLHAPDPRVPWATSVRALAGLLERGMVRHIGVSNVNRAQLKEALDLAPLTAVEVALGAGDDEALRGGVVALALERGLWVLAHSPLGGPLRAARLSRDARLAAVAARLDATPAQVVLRGLLEMHPRVVALPGARRPETARSAAAAARLVLDEESRAALEERLGGPHPPRAAGPLVDGEVVLIAGLSGAGKSTAVQSFVASGWVRLNRDERGGTLAGIAAALDERLRAGARRVVLDNTYLTRASRAGVLRVAARHRVAARCVWLDVPLVEAQRNAVERTLEAHGRLLEPDEMAGGGDDPTRLGPRVQLSQLRRLEPPDVDEGFAAVEVIPFVRRAPSGRERAGTAVALEALRARGPAVLDEGQPGPRLVFAWLPGGDAPLVEATRGLPVETAACTHGAGPPVCWCRPPLPGLLLAFARRNGVDPARLVVVGVTTAHRQLAAAVGARFVDAT